MGKKKTKKTIRRRRTEKKPEGKKNSRSGKKWETRILPTVMENQVSDLGYFGNFTDTKGRYG